MFTKLTKQSYPSIRQKTSGVTSANLEPVKVKADQSDSKSRVVFVTMICSYMSTKLPALFQTQFELVEPKYD